MTRYDWINNVLNNATIWDTETFGTIKGQGAFSHAFIDPGSSVKEEYFDFSQDTYNKGSKYGRDLFDKLKFNKNGTVNPEYLNSPKLNAGDTFFDFLSSRIKQKRIFILHNPKFDFNVASEEMGLKRTEEIKKLLGQDTVSDVKARRLEQLRGNAAKWSPAEYKKQLQYALSINTNPDHGFNPRRMISGTSTTGAVKSGMSDAAFDRFKSILMNKTGKESFIINTQDMAGMLYGMADSRGYASFEGDYFSATKTSFISRLLGNPKQTHNKTDVLHTEDIFRKLGVMLEEVHSGSVSATTSEFLDRASILNREWSRQGLYTSLAEYAGDAYFDKKIYTKTRINSRNPVWTELNQDDVINSAIDLIERDVPKFGPRSNSSVKLSRDQMRTAFERFYNQAEKAGSKDAYYDRILKKVSSDERFLKRMGPAGIPGAAEIDDVEGFFKSARNSQEELIGRRGKGFLLGVAGIAAGATLYAMASNSTKTKQTDVDLSDYERDIAYRDSRSILPKKLNNPISQFISGDPRDYNTIEGLHPGGGVNAQMIREMTDFGSPWKGLFGSKSLKTAEGMLEFGKSTRNARKLYNIKSISTREFESKLGLFAPEGFFGIFGANTDVAKYMGLEEGIHSVFNAKSLKQKFGGKIDKDVARVFVAHEIFEAKYTTKLGIDRAKANMYGSHVSPAVIADEAMLSMQMGKDVFGKMRKIRSDEYAELVSLNETLNGEIDAPLKKYLERSPVDIYDNVEKKWGSISKKYGVESNDVLHGRSGENIEGLHPEGKFGGFGSWAKKIIQNMTDFGSGYRGPVAPVHHNVSEDYNEANDAYVYESMRASKIGLSETELYKYMTEEQGEFPAYVQASSAAGTILHAKQQAQGYAASLDGGPSYEAERLVLDTKYGISGHIDEITPQGLGDIKTVSGGIFNTISESGQPKPMHKSQVMFYLGQTGSERGYIRYVDRDNTSREKTFMFDYNAEEYRALLRKVERVRAEVNQDLARGLLNKWNMPKAASFDTLRAEDAKKETAVEFASKVDQYNHMFREEMAYLKTLKRGMPQGGAGRNRIEDANKRRQERQYNRVAGIGLQSFNDRIGHGIM